MNDLSDGELIRYSRQILLDGWDIDAQLALKQTKAVIVGVGGLGCAVAEILVRAGIGHLHLIDFDVIDDSNLQRQTLYTPLTVGKSKVKTAQKTLTSINKFVNVSYDDIRLTDDNIDTLTWAYDLLIDCSDNFGLRFALNRLSVQQKIPLLSSSAIGMKGQIALFEPTKTGCYACLFGEHLKDNASCATSGVLASTVAVVGAMTANVALAFLAQKNNTLANKLALWNGQALSLNHVGFLPDCHCPACRHLQTPKNSPTSQAYPSIPNT